MQMVHYLFLRKRISILSDHVAALTPYGVVMMLMVQQIPVYQFKRGDGIIFQAWPESLSMQTVAPC